MSNYIDKQAAIDALGERPMTWTNSDYELGCANQYDLDRLAIETVPTANVQPVRHGHWALQEDRTKKLYGWHICSECGAWIGEPTNYCSNCGADMRGEQSGTD